MSIPDIPITMPLAPKDMVNDLIRNHRYTLKKLAKDLCLSPRTVYRLQQGECKSPKAIAKMIMLYCRL